MLRIGRRLAWVVAAAGLFISGQALGQATAPVTNHRHEHHHNEKHPVVNDPALIITNRQGAELSLPTGEPMFTFIVFGDRTGGPNEGIDVLAEAVADANLLEPDLVMTVGDLVNGYNTAPEWMEQMKQYKEVMGELRCPWLPVAGNHDVYARGEDPGAHHEKEYEMYFGPLWYAFKHKNCWFVVLYSDEGDPKTGKKSISLPETQMMSPEQFDWLKGILKKAGSADHVFLFLHHPRWVGKQYGDDWQKVHDALVEAGNVTAVFAGHFHTMFYDKKDGIEYVTLATVGGHQSQRVPEAGYLHQFHHVTVRKNQIALASIPVGGTMDVRQITSDVAQMARKLSDVRPAFGMPLEVGGDGSASGRFDVLVTNPTENAIEASVTPSSEDLRWHVTPDHYHTRLGAGESAALTFEAHRPGGSLDDYTRPLEVALGMDLLTETARYAIPSKSDVVPGSVALPAPATPGEEMVLRLNGNKGAAVISAERLGLVEGPFTFECWVKPEKFADRSGAMGAPGFGLWFEKGRPVCYVYAGGKWFDASTPDGRTLEPGKAHHLAGVYDGAELRFYIDGELVSTVPVEGKVRLAGDAVTFGAETTPGGEVNTLDGWVDDVRISDVARYAGERFTPMHRPTPDEHTLLLLYMDANQHGYLYDASGHKAHTKLKRPARVRKAG